MKKVFDPLISAAGRAPKNSLYTQHIPQERKPEQFKRFKNLETDISRVAPLPGGGFLAILKENDDEIILLCTPSLSPSEVAELTDACIREMDTSEIEFDETMFIIGLHDLPSFFQLKSSYRTQDAARDIVDLADTAEYDGHSIYDLMTYYQPVSALRVHPGNSIHGMDIASLALLIIFYQRNLRSPIVDTKTYEKIIKLRGKVGCKDDNLFQALTASQWRHAFLDLYRCLESLFFFPWMKKLKDDIGANLNIEALHEHVHAALSWNAKEDQSIASLFELVGEKEPLRSTEEIGIFSDLLSQQSSRPSSFADRVYQARNMLVHHEDKTRKKAPPQALKIIENCVALSAIS